MAVARGRADDGSTFTLRGRSLRIELRRRLNFAPRRRPARARVTCGDNAGYPLDRWNDAGPFAAKANRVITVPPTRRVITLRLPRDLTARTNYCGIETLLDPSYSGGGAVDADAVRATMRLVAGRRPDCRPLPGETVIAQDSATTILQVGPVRPAWRRCSGTGPRKVVVVQGLETTHTSYTLLRPTLAGPFFAWAEEWWDVGSHSFYISTVDVISGRPLFQPMEPSGPVDLEALALSDQGVLAWRVSPQDRHLNPTPQTPWSISARQRGGAPVILDSSHSDDLADVAVAETTVTWTHSGEQRSYSFPSAK
jgi:hypothetical protein